MEFLTVYKDGESKQTSRALLARDQANGWTIDPDDTTVVTTEEHGEQLVPTSEAVENEQATFVHQEEQVDKRIQETRDIRRSGALEGVQAFGESALNTLLPGVGAELSRDLAGAVGEGREAVKQRAEDRNVASLAGSITGTLVGVLNPTGLASKAPVGLAAKLATKAGKSVAKRTGSKVGGMIAEGAVDGALIGSIQRYAEATIKDEPITVEQVLSGLPSDVLFGAATGGVLGALGKVSKNLSKTPKVSNKLELDGLIDSVESNVKSVMINVSKTGKRLKNKPFSLTVKPSKFKEQLAHMHMNRAGQEVIDPVHVKKLVKEYPSLSKPLIENGIPTPLGESAVKAGLDLQLSTVTPESELLSKLWLAKRVEKYAEKEVAKNLNLGVFGNSIKGLTGLISTSKNIVTGGTRKLVKVLGKPRERAVRSTVGVLGSVKYAVLPDDEKGENTSEKSNVNNNSKLRDVFNKRAKELHYLTDNPEIVKEQIYNNFSEIRQIKPELAEQLSAAAYNRFKFLSTIVPSRRPSQFGKAKYYPTETEIAKFSKIAMAVENPVESIYEGLETGRLTQETVDTVKQLNPELYKEIISDIMNNITEIKEKSSYSDLMQLGILFQIPIHETLEPDFIQMLQSKFVPEETGSMGNVTTPGNVQKSIKANETVSQRMEGK